MPIVLPVSSCQAATGSRSGSIGTRLDARARGRSAGATKLSTTADLVAGLRQVQRRGPAQVAVPAQHQDPHRSLPPFLSCRSADELHVDAALGLAGAGPAAAARVLARRDPAGAWRAADRRVAVVQQRVDQDAVLGDVVVDLLSVQRASGVTLTICPSCRPTRPRRAITALVGLVPAHARCPRVVAAQRAVQRLDLAQLAAQVGVALVQVGRRTSASCSATVWTGVTLIRFTGRSPPTASRVPIVSAKW